MGIWARKFFGIGTAVRVWCTIGVTLQRDGGHSDDGTCGQLLFQLVIVPLAFSQTDPPAVTMDHDTDMIRVVEGCSAALERRIIEVPLRRSELPDELVKIMPVFFVASAAAFGRKIKLVPPFELSLGRQWHLVSFRVADQISTHGDSRLTAFRPQRRYDVGCPRSPIKTADDGLLDRERIHQMEDVERNDRLLAIPERVIGKKT